MLPKPYYDDGTVTVYHGDCLEIIPELKPVDVVLTDPPYGETSLKWDRYCKEWSGAIGTALKTTGSLWCFGSLRMFMSQAQSWKEWTFAQDVVWEKQNGSGFHADRFKRIHEHICQFYKGEWARIYKSPVVTMDVTAKTVRRKSRPTHTGHIDKDQYVSFDGGPRLMKSIFRVKNCHGYADHPTQKPLGVIVPLINYSCPPGGTILDPFGGSLSTAVAAKALGRKCITIEISEEYCERGVKRLAQGVLSL